MGVAKVPPGDAPEEERIQPAKVWYSLWYVPAFPLDVMGGKLDKDIEERPWLLGLLDDIRRAGRFRNPVIVWNHHKLRGTKQPGWLLRAGSNRVWCAQQLGWAHVPAVVSCVLEDQIRDGHGFCHFAGGGRWPGERIRPEDLQSYFPDGGNLWANEHGFGLLRAKPPEVTYADYKATEDELKAVRPTNNGTRKMVTPW